MCTIFDLEHPLNELVLEKRPPSPTIGTTQIQLCLTHNVAADYLKHLTRKLVQTNRGLLHQYIGNACLAGNIGEYAATSKTKKGHQCKYKSMTRKKMLSKKKKINKN